MTGHCSTSNKIRVSRVGSGNLSIKCGIGTGCGFADAGSRAIDSRERSASARRLWLVVILCVFFMSLEVAGGIKANSLAILTDAAHLLSDVASFAISLFAMWASSWEATPRQTFGFFRLEILGALVSIQLIWLITGILVYEAIDRMLHNNLDVDGRLMFIVASFGLAVNLVMAFVLGHDHGDGHSHRHEHQSHSHDIKEEHDHTHNGQHNHNPNGHSRQEDEIKEHLLPSSTLGHEHHKQRNVEKSPHGRTLCLDEDIEKGQSRSEKGKNINVEGAYLHVLGDLIQSIGVMTGGAVIWAKPEWKIVDLFCTLFFSVLVLATTLRMLRNILEVLMESTPGEIDATKLEGGLLAIPGVVAVHELHIWAITMGKILLACHVRIQSDANADHILQKVIDYCEKDYKISHVTIQIERESR